MADPLLLAFAALAAFIALALFFGALKKMLQWLVTLAINSALGLVLLYALNMLGLGVPVTWLTIALIAVFGLPAVAILAILSFFGVI